MLRTVLSDVLCSLGASDTPMEEEPRPVVTRPPPPGAGKGSTMVRFKDADGDEIEFRLISFIGRFRLEERVNGQVILRAVEHLQWDASNRHLVDPNGTIPLRHMKNSTKLLQSIQSLAIKATSPGCAWEETGSKPTLWEPVW